MTQKIIYGTDSETILGLDEAVILLVPDDVDDVEEYLEDHYEDIPQRKIAIVRELVDQFVVAMHAEGFSPEAIGRVTVTVAQQIMLDEKYPD